MTQKILKEILSWVMVIVIAFVLAKIIDKLIIYKVSSPTASMETTIMIGDKVETFKLAYLFSGPKRGDIVVFEAPDTPEEDYLKRVIGIPGDKVEIKLGQLYINDKLFKEDYLKAPMNEEENDGPFLVPEGHYFMMGDNREISEDARVWENKYVARNKIKGKALFKFPDFKWLF